MVAFLNQIFKNVNREKFKKYSPFLSLFADLILFYYIQSVMLPRFMQREKIIPMLERFNPYVRELPSYEIDNLMGMLQTNFTLTFTIILAFNAIMYALAGRGHKTGIKFLYGYVFSTCLLSAVELVGSVFTDKIPFSWGTLITMVLYLYVYLGMRHFKIKQDIKKSPGR